MRIVINDPLSSFSFEYFYGERISLHFLKDKNIALETISIDFKQGYSGHVSILTEMDKAYHFSFLSSLKIYIL